MYMFSIVFRQICISSIFYILCYIIGYNSKTVSLFIRQYFFNSIDWRKMYWQWQLCQQSDFIMHVYFLSSFYSSGGDEWLHLVTSWMTICGRNLSIFSDIRANTSKPNMYWPTGIYLEDVKMKSYGDANLSMSIIWIAKSEIVVFRRGEVFLNQHSGIAVASHIQISSLSDLNRQGSICTGVSICSGVAEDKISHAAST